MQEVKKEAVSDKFARLRIGRALREAGKRAWRLRVCGLAVERMCARGEGRLKGKIVEALRRRVQTVVQVERMRCRCLVRCVEGCFRSWLRWWGVGMQACVESVRAELSKARGEWGNASQEMGGELSCSVCVFVHRSKREEDRHGKTGGGLMGQSVGEG